MKRQNFQRSMNQNRRFVQEKMRPVVEKKLCKVFEGYMKSFSNRLKQHPVKMPLAMKNSVQGDLIDYRLLKDDAQRSFILRQFLQIVESLLFDRSLMKQPEFNDNFGDIALKGWVLFFF